jgi:hypothetical protein
MTSAYSALTLGLSDIEGMTGGRFGVIDVPCPSCGPEKRNVSSQRRRVLRIWRSEELFASYKCARCELRGYARGHGTGPRGRVGASVKAGPTGTPAFPRPEVPEQREKARWLWERRQPLTGSIGERYLREARGYGGSLPRTIGFLPAKGGRPPCMISVVGTPNEAEPGVVEVDEVAAVHLTKLAGDGRGKAGTDADKIMIGSPRGVPIAVAAVNDGLGLIIAEGIEDALSAAEATGLGAWAAGSAPFLPYLATAVPDYVESVTCIVDDDKAGRRKSSELAERLEDRGFEVRLFYPARSRAA